MRFFAIPGLCGTLVMLFLHPAAVRAAQINVALGNPVVQSTNGFGFDGSLAVDGDRTLNSISHTDSGDLAPFLEVDLGESFPIENINVATRDNCCTPGSPERDYNVLVEVRNASDAILYSSPVFNPWDGTGAGATDLGNGFVFQLDLTSEPGGAVTGQKVRVRKTQAFGASEWLHVAELEVLVDPSVTPIVSLTVDRDSGALTWKNNTGSDLDLLGYSLTSSTGSFDQTGWTPVASNYDAPAHGGDGSVDADDPWTVLTVAGTHTDLSESELAGGDGGTIQNGQSVDLGSGVWIKNPTEDIAMQILRTDGAIDDVTVVFDGNGGQPFQRSDLNFDGTIDEADWTVYVAGLEVDLSGKAPAEAYQMGDLDYDGVNSVNDFAIFKADFNAANGPGAFAAMIASVPEPSSLALLGLGGLLLLVGSSRHAGRFRGPNTDRLVTSAIVGGVIIGVLAIAAQGRAQDVNLALGQPVIQSTDGFGFNGSLAVDGIRTGNSISHTNSGDLTPFLEVDLGESIPIENINVATRDNCCTPDQPERDYNILVEVRDASDTILYSSPIFNPWDGTGAGATDLGNGFVFQLDLTGEPGGAVTGQKVRASKTQAFGGSEWLHVAELEVFTGLQNVPRLGLTVNRTTGEISLANRFDTGFTTDYYRISSAADSLDPSRWRSLDQQDFGALGPDIGDSWDEAAGADTGLLAEAFLKGSSTFAASASITLGAAYAQSVDSQDLLFEYRDPSNGDVLQGFVEYVTVGVILGDVNQDSLVNGLDVDPFVDVLLNGPYQAEADMNVDSEVNGLDVDLFVEAVVGGGVQAVPEPSTLALVGLAGLVLVVRISRGGNVMKRSTSLSLLVAGLLVALVGSAARADVTLDRNYLFGDNTGVPAQSENATAGQRIGSGAGGVTFDTVSKPASDPTSDNDAQNLTPTGSVGPKYVAVGSGDFQRTAQDGDPTPPSPLDLGAQFNGSSEYLRGARLGYPATAAGTLGYSDPPAVWNPNDYTGIVNRGYQLWVYPTSSAAAQTVVMDTNQHGVRISADGNWSMRYNNSNVDSTAAVATGEWSHVMVVRQTTGSRLYVDGVGVAAAGGNYSFDDNASLVLGSNTGVAVGSDEFFGGVLDNLKMFVTGTSTGANPEDFGTFDLATDNQYVAGVVGGLPDGDVNMDNELDQETDVDAFVAGWLNVNTVNGIQVGDLSSRGAGDLNFDGITDLNDAFILHEALAAAGGGLDFSALTTAVPEPSTLVLLILAAVIGLLWRRR